MIDLRSDTVTKPSIAMREAIAGADVGDDVWGDDPTVQELESTAASILGKEAGLYLSSGTQSNLCALLAHCQRGDEYLVGENAHTYRYEAGGAAVLGSIQPQPVHTLPNGRLDLEHAESVIKPDDPHFARSRLLCLENTHDGHVLPLHSQSQARDLARRHDIALHLDGARLWNAAVSLGESPATVAEPFDTVSVCLSKGLGAPVGSILVGSTELVTSARRWRKMLGGGMRQAGIIAAGGLFALNNNIERLADDHLNATSLAEGLEEIDGVSVTGHATNMVFAEFDQAAEPILAAAEARGVRLAVGAHGTARSSSRMVTHLGIDAADIETVVGVIASALS